MNFINQLAYDFCKHRFTKRGQLNSPPQAVIDDARQQLLEIIDTKDRIIFIKTILEAAENCKLEHLKVCTNHNCQSEKQFDTILYFVGQELLSYGITLNEDTFSYEERQAAINKIDQLLTEVEILKQTNSTLEKSNETVSKELAELKEILFIGKKHWYLLSLGVLKGMVIENIIDKETEKHFLSLLKPITNNYYFNVINHGSITTLNQGERIESVIN